MTDIAHEKCILLVEDNPDDVALTLRALKQNRIVNHVVVANDGAEARDFLFGVGTHEGRDVCEVPQLILLDLKIPKISGLDLLRRIRAFEHTKLVPVVILTSSPLEEDLINGYGLGANSYVRKPLDYKEFFEAIRNIGIYWLAINKPPPEPHLPRDRAADESAVR